MFLFPYRDENYAKNFPIVTTLLIVCNAYFFLNPLITDNLNQLYVQYGFTPRSALTRPWVLVTSIFLHGGFIHLISNMWFLWLFGDNIEDKFGRFHLLGMYLTAGIVGNLLHAVLTGFRSDMMVIGASGAVAGIMGAYLVRFPTAKLKCIFLIIIIPISVRIRAFWFLGFYMVFEFITAFVGVFDHVAHWAHIGGFGYGFYWAYRRKR